MGVQNLNLNMKDDIEIIWNVIQYQGSKNGTRNKNGVLSIKLQPLGIKCTQSKLNVHLECYLGD